MNLHSTVNFESNRHEISHHVRIQGSRVIPIRCQWPTDRFILVYVQRYNPFSVPLILIQGCNMLQWKLLGFDEVPQLQDWISS